MWCGRARVPGTRGHGGTRAACRRRPPRRRAVGHVSASLATHGAHREPGPGWAPRVDVGAGGGRRVSCSRRVTFGSRAAHRGLPRGRPGLWPCISLPARLLGLLRGARGLGVHGQGSRLPGGQARQRGASRGGSSVVAGADEDAGLCCGLVGPRVQRVGALLTPGVGGETGGAPATGVFTPASPGQAHADPGCPRAGGSSLNEHLLSQAPPGPSSGLLSPSARTHTRAHLKQLRWYSLPSARCRCTRCTCCPQMPQVLLTEPTAAWPCRGEPLTGLPHLPSSQPPRQIPPYRPESVGPRGGPCPGRRTLCRVSSLAQGQGAGG